MKKWKRYDEYRALKRRGMSFEDLKSHFGDELYESGIYNRKSSISSYLQFITEIIVNPKEVEYTVKYRPSDIYDGVDDILFEFNDNDINYIINLYYFKIGDIVTYNILLTTGEQWSEYLIKLDIFRQKGFLTNDESEILSNILEKETDYGRLFKIMNKASFILLDYFKDKRAILSLGEVKREVKINLYRNIIRSSFSNVEEMGEYLENGMKYYLYKINY